MAGKRVFQGKYTWFRILHFVVVYSAIMGFAYLLEFYHAFCPFGVLLLLVNKKVVPVVVVFFVYLLLVEMLYPRMFCSICPVGLIISPFKEAKFAKLFCKLRKVFSVIGWLVFVSVALGIGWWVCRYVCPLNFVESHFDIRFIGGGLVLIVAWLFSKNAICSNGICPVEKVWRFAWMVRRMLRGGKSGV